MHSKTIYTENDTVKTARINVGLSAIWVKSGTKDTLYYTHTDHQGSITEISSQYQASAIQKLSYDPWGRRRSATDWKTNNVNPAQLLFARGYTGHEHMDEFNLINMNGRVYDPILGMFLSPDPFVQNPANPLNYNRYSYCTNNPLKYTDPSGYVMLNWTDFESSSQWFDYVNNALPSFNNGGGVQGMQSFGGKPAYVTNGTGLNGIYYDWNSGNYRFTGSGNDINWQTAFSIAMPNQALIDVQWQTVGFFYYDSYGNPTTINGQSGEFWIVESNVYNNSQNSSNVVSTLGKISDYAGFILGAVEYNFGKILADRAEYSVQTMGGKVINSATNNSVIIRTPFGNINNVPASASTYLKFGGITTFAITTFCTYKNVAAYYENGGNDPSIAIKAGIDVGFGLIGFAGHIGFGVSASYFVLNAVTNGFGGYGAIPNN